MGACLMCAGTTLFLVQQWPTIPFLGFVLFSTLCSYNLHWYFSVHAQDQGNRTVWSQKYRSSHLSLFWLGLGGSVFFGLFLLKFWVWMALAAFLTFLYTAPKLPFEPLNGLKKIAYGKTFYLALVWTYVTCILPLVTLEPVWKPEATGFILHRFFLIYANCILFDLRDRDADIREGIRSLITWLNEKGIRFLFTLSILLSLLSVFWPNRISSGWAATATLCLPAVLLAALYSYFRKNQSDYLYYGLLDGLLILSSVLLIGLEWMS